MLAMVLTAAGSVPAAAAPSIARYDERVVVDADGTRETHVSIDLGADAPERLRIPTSDIDPSSLTASGDEAGTIQVRWDAERKLIEVHPVADRAWPSHVTLAFRQPPAGDATSLNVERTFTNVNDAAMTECTLEIVLPPGFVFESADGRDDSHAAARLVFTSHDGRHAVRVTGSLAPTAGRMSLQAHGVPRHPPMWLPYVALGLAALYMVRFRDLVRRPA